MSVNNPSENVSDRFRVCSLVFIKIKRKRNLKGEFMKIFKEVFNQKVLPDDGHPRAIFDTCRYRIETSWKRNCNWEVTESKKKKWYAFVMTAAEKITLFPNTVGNCPKTSLLPTMFSIVSFCSDFNSLSGNTAKLSEQLQNTPQLIYMSLNKNSVYCVMPRSSKPPDTCK